MARYRPRKPRPAHESRHKARSIRAVRNAPRLRDLVGDDPLGLITQVGQAMIDARSTDHGIEIPDRIFGHEDFWPEDTL